MLMAVNGQIASVAGTCGRVLKLSLRRPPSRYEWCGRNDMPVYKRLTQHKCELGVSILQQGGMPQLVDGLPITLASPWFPLAPLVGRLCLQARNY